MNALFSDWKLLALVLAFVLTLLVTAATTGGFRGPAEETVPATAEVSR